MTAAKDLGAAVARIEEWTRHSDERANKADHDREKMMQAILALTAAQERLADDMAEVKPVTTMVMGVRAKMAGAMILLGFVGSIALVGAQYFREVIIRWMGW